MSRMYQLLKTVYICIIVITISSLTSLASDQLVPGDLDGDQLVSDDELAKAYQDHENGNISSDEVQQIQIIHDRYPIEVTDSAGNIIKIYKPLNRVVVINGQVTEMMQILNATDVIIGVTTDLQTEPLIKSRLKSLPTVGKVVEPDMEAILRLDPDAVIHYASTMWKTDEIQANLQKADPDLIVIRLDIFDPKTHLDEVEKLGKIFDREDEANEYIDFYKGVLNEIQGATSGLSDEEKPWVYFEERIDFQTGSSETYISENTEIAGGRNVFADLKTRYPVVDQESIMLENPDIIVRVYSNKSYGGYINDDTSVMEDLRESIINRPGSEYIDAVKEGRVYVIYASLIGGARHIVGISYLAKIFHPDLLTKLDPVDVHQKYLDFMGYDFDLNVHRAFVVPDI